MPSSGRPFLPPGGVAQPCRGRPRGSRVSREASDDETGFGGMLGGAACGDGVRRARRLRRQPQGEPAVAVSLAGPSPDDVRPLLDMYGGHYVGEKVVYLTFDEGYENGYTAQILDKLQEAGARVASAGRTGSAMRRSSGASPCCMLSRAATPARCRGPSTR